MYHGSNYGLHRVFICSANRIIGAVVHSASCAEYAVTCLVCQHTKSVILPKPECNLMFAAVLFSPWLPYRMDVKPLFAFQLNGTYECV